MHMLYVYYICQAYFININFLIFADLRRKQGYDKREKIK